MRPSSCKGSWAGAFGPTQFMPTAFKRYAVDFDGDGRRDVVDSMPDVIASTANNLKKDGWVTGQTWGYEVVVPQGFNFLLADRARKLTLREWERLGIRRAGGKPFPRPSDNAYLLVPAGAQGPAFLMLHEFPRHHEIQSRPRPMRWRSAILPTGCAAAGPSCRLGRATSGC